MSGLGQHLCGIMILDPHLDQGVLPGLLSCAWGSCKTPPCGGALGPPGMTIQPGTLRGTGTILRLTPGNVYPKYFTALAGWHVGVTPAQSSCPVTGRNKVNWAFWRHSFFPGMMLLCATSKAALVQSHLSPRMMRHRDRCKWEKIRIKEINIWRIQAYAHKYKYIYI